MGEANNLCNDELGETMCQATVYLNNKEIMRDVSRVECLPEGVRLTTFFEQPRVVPATIREVDLLKHRVLLELLVDLEEENERSRQTAGSDTPLD